MESKEGIQAWMRAMQGQPLPPRFPSLRTAAPGANDKNGARAKKNKRKAARNARRKKR
jgi:hypothetical protein